MEHAITVADLLRTLGAIIGVILAIIGLLEMFAAGMSDALVTGKRMVHRGFIVFVTGAALIIAMAVLG